MAVLAAVNLEDGLVLLEDGRELPITGYYRGHNKGLTAKSELRTEHRVNCWQDAEVFAVAIPGAGTALIVEISSLGFAKPSDIN